MRNHSTLHIGATLLILGSLCVTAFGMGTVPSKKTASAPTPGQPVRLDLGDGLDTTLLYVGPGEFTMGSEDGDSDEKPVRKVRITQGFWLGKCEVTHAEYGRFLKESGYDGRREADPDYLKHLGGEWKDHAKPTHPVVWISLHNAVAYCDWLTQIEQKAGRLPKGYVYRLPTEAEWEYAARGATQSRNHTYAGADETGGVAWYAGNSGNKAQPVGSKAPNELGLHDMSGNVWEWCLDWYAHGFYGKSPTVDPVNLKGGAGCAIRGGSARDPAADLRSASRDRLWASSSCGDLGFRACLGPAAQTKHKRRIVQQMPEKRRAVQPAQRTERAADPARAETFLANHTNPKEAEATARDPLGVYPYGPRMWLSGYSDKSRELQMMVDAGMTLSGPHYGNAFPHKNYARALSKGLKSYYRLRVGGSWRTLLRTFYKTTPIAKYPTGRAYQEAAIRGCIENVLQDKDREGNPAPGLNDAVVGWYNPHDEPMGINAGSEYDLDNQLEFLAAVHQVVKDTDTKKRPFMLSNRGDSVGLLQKNQSVSDVCLKQNYYIRGSDWCNDPELNTPWNRYIVGDWVRRQHAVAASYNGGISSYTGYEIPVITTLSIYIDPRDPAWRTEKRLRLMIEHDFWLSIAMRAHGVVLYSWPGSAAPATRRMQQKIYMEVIKRFTDNNLPAVFLWGDNRTDITMDPAAARQSFVWGEYRKKNEEPSIMLRNIQYRKNRYILLVNSDPADTIPVTLSGFPAKGVQHVDLMTGVSSPFDIGRSGTGEIRVTLAPLQYAVYKVMLGQND